MMKGLDKLTYEQNMKFAFALDRFMKAQGGDMRKNMEVEAVEVEGNDFKITLTRYGKKGYQYLHSNGQWS